MKSCDSTDDEYHLTPDGWIRGTHYCYGKAAKIVECPENCAETWIKRRVRQMRQSYSYAREEIEWKCIWISTDYSEHERIALQEKYPRPE